MEFVDSTSDAAGYNHAVLIYPPSDRQARTMFKLILHQELEAALTRTSIPTKTSNTSSSSGSKKVAWSDRGWRRKEDFHTEMEAALGDGGSALSGIVIARAQTLSEAEALRAQLAVSAAQVKTAIVPLSVVRMYSSVAPPPSRTLPSSSASSSSSSSSSISGGGEEKGNETDPPVQSICAPSDVRHHIVLYAPDSYLAEDYAWDTPASNEFIEQWFDREIERTLCRIMRGTTVDRNRSNRAGDNEEELDDVDEDVPGTFSWSDRGWVGRQLFLAHTKASLKKTGRCSFLRRATLSDAMAVFRDLEEAGFFASLFVTPALEAEKGEEDRPVVMCPENHPTVAVDNGYHGTCSTCFGQSRPDDLMMRCALCEYDLCSACVTERTQLPCPVIAGRYCGDTLIHPDTSAMPITLPAEEQNRREGGVDALTFLSQQVVGDNTNIGGGGDEESAMMSRLDGVFGRMGVEKNGKPKAKASAVAALERQVLGDGEFAQGLKDESCIICMNDFTAGDVVMKMPCGHWFHEGELKDGKDEEKEEDLGADDDEGPCDGILPWLQTSNRCPMCREEIEADTGASMEKLLPSLSGHWRCPGCHEEHTSYSCTTCDVRRNVIIAATQTALPFFDLVDALFFDFLGHHERKRRGQAASVHELELYYLRIQFLISSHEGQQLLQNSWLILDAVEHLLKQAFKGAKSYTFSSPYMDNNSKALYVLLLDRLKDKIKTLNQTSIGIKFESPSFAASSEQVAMAWSCPLCAELNDAMAKACGVCGCESKALIIAESHEEMQNTKRVFLNAENLVFRAFDIMSDRHASDGVSLSCTAALEVLRKEADQFLGSLDVRRLEHSGWKIRCHLASLFDGLCKQEASVPFQYYSDVTSAGLYAVLVRRLRARLAEDTERITEYGQFSVQEPQPNSLLKQDEEYEQLTGQRFYVHGQTFGLLQSQRKFFIMIAHLIAQRANEHYWGDTSKVLSKFGEAWPIASRVEMMKGDERDLDVLTDDMECFSQSVVEALWRKVVAIEKAMGPATTTSNNASSSSTTTNSKSSDDTTTSAVAVADLKPETDIAVAALSLLQAVKDKDDSTFQQALKQLTKTLRALKTNPNALSSRKLRKNTPAVAQGLLPHEEMMDLIARLGFVDEGASFSLIKLDADAIEKTLLVVESFAADGTGK